MRIDLTSQYYLWRRWFDLTDKVSVKALAVNSAGSYLLVYVESILSPIVFNRLFLLNPANSSLALTFAVELDQAFGEPFRIRSNGLMLEGETAYMTLDYLTVNKMAFLGYEIFPSSN